MQGDKTIIQQLNKILYNELVAINQYFLHSKILKNQGFHKLAGKEFHESVDEMKHAEMLTERILFLEGLPNLQDLGRLRIGENIEEILKGDLALEVENAIPDLKVAIQACETARDFASRDLLTAILKSEEEHADFLETQIGLIARVGIANYSQSMME